MEFSLKGLSDKAIKVLEIVKYIGVAVVSFLIYHQYLFFGGLYGMISYTNHTIEGGRYRENTKRKICLDHYRWRKRTDCDTETGTRNI